jgi:hypothetical protein
MPLRLAQNVALTPIYIARHLLRGRQDAGAQVGDRLIPAMHLLAGARGR